MDPDLFQQRLHALQSQDTTWQCPHCPREFPRRPRFTVTWHRGLGQRREHCYGCHRSRHPDTGEFSLDKTQAYNAYERLYINNLAAK